MEVFGLRKGWKGAHYFCPKNPRLIACSQFSLNGGHIKSRHVCLQHCWSSISIAFTLYWVHGCSFLKIHLISYCLHTALPLAIHTQENNYTSLTKECWYCSVSIFLHLVHQSQLVFWWIIERHMFHNHLYINIKN